MLPSPTAPAPRRRPWLGPLASALVLLAGCGRAPTPASRPDCQRLADQALAERARLLRHGVRAVSRAALEALDRQLQRTAGQCGRLPPGARVRRARAELRDAVARATGTPEDVKGALLAWADAEGPGVGKAEAASALGRRADLAFAHDRRSEGFALLARLRDRYPGSPEAARARRALGVLAALAPAPSPARRRPSRTRPVPPTPFRGRAVDPDRLGIPFRATLERPARLLRVRRWSTPAFTRVVAYFTEPVRYLHGVLPADGLRPARLYLDFPASVLGPQVERAQAVQGHLVRGLRFANRPPAGARLVADLAAPLRYDIYPLQHPYRVVMDLWRADAAPRPAPGTEPAVRVVALDPGHGGPENGAVGSGGTKEKDVTLAVARHAATLLRQRGLQAVLTREGDHGISLEERSALALTVGADLFVSIHANAEPTGKQTGIETYYLDLESDQYAARLADRENRAAGGRPVSQYRLVLADLTTRALTRRSQRLARAVQAGLLAQARRQRPGLPDRGVRRAIFHVLLTARVPGILTEISFLSNPAGEAALRDPATLQRLGAGIAQGVLAYARSGAPTPRPRPRAPAPPARR